MSGIVISRVFATSIYSKSKSGDVTKQKLINGLCIQKEYYW